MLLCVTQICAQRGASSRGRIGGGGQSDTGIVNLLTCALGTHVTSHHAMHTGGSRGLREHCAAYAYQHLLPYEASV